MLFSQRMGYTPATKAIQMKEMDRPLRNGLWNVLAVDYFGEESFNQNYLYETHYEDLIKHIWRYFFKRKVNETPELSSDALASLREFFDKNEWYTLYDIMEYILGFLKSYDPGRVPYLVEQLNGVLEIEMSGYRIVDTQVAPITDETELAAIDDSIASTETPRLTGANTHLKTALEMLSNRVAPDYRNSIKESISAVESLCAVLTNNPKSTLGSALSILEKQGNLHPALKNGWSSLYGYTSDAGGIRHALLDEPKISFADAKYMLVACSAFVNYLVNTITTDT